MTHTRHKQHLLIIYIDVSLCVTYSVDEFSPIPDSVISARRKIKEHTKWITLTFNFSNDSQRRKSKHFQGGRERDRDSQTRTCGSYLNGYQWHLRCALMVCRKLTWLHEHERQSISLITQFVRLFGISLKLFYRFTVCTNVAILLVRIVFWIWILIINLYLNKKKSNNRSIVLHVWWLFKCANDAQ